MVLAQDEIVRRFGIVDEVDSWVSDQSLMGLPDLVAPGLHMVEQRKVDSVEFTRRGIALLGEYSAGVHILQGS
ncbi:MAG: hypothetical protein HOJ56_11000 [Acidimicrobiaceae bacterium]|nr:hypothetical protein [Acidimicrobiaceae bacterium]